MRAVLLTLFPEFFDSPLRVGVLGRAISRGLVCVECVNPREYATDRHRRADDYGFGGGHGMVMKPEPLAAAIWDVRARAPGVRVFALTPGGEPFTSDTARELAHAGAFALVCGRYDGIDQRVIDHHCDGEISAGDFVMSGGEIAALAIVDAAARFVPGVVGKGENVETDSFNSGLKWPVYTRPDNFDGLRVPEVLRTGDAAAVEGWRRDAALARTIRFRPTLVVAAGAHRIGLEFAGCDGVEAAMTAWPLVGRFVRGAIYVHADADERSRFRVSWGDTPNAWVSPSETAATDRWRRLIGRFERMRIGFTDDESARAQIRAALIEGLGVVLRVEGGAGADAFARIAAVLDPSFD
ncbi:MAG: tRNA (guanosine(37)-N1)-methyltransferase TrmD [Deltaproteobacteria bacterium]|nr:tRNA (guanosine(37)-N1)-methyltransferase TrmD [Deltaproteobacteria bacterium]